MYIFGNAIDYSNKINDGIYNQLVIKNSISRIKSMNEKEIERSFCNNKKFIDSNSLFEFLNIKSSMKNLRKEYNLSIIKYDENIKITLNDKEDIYVY